LKKWNPEVIRAFFAQAHYRSPPDFSEEAIENAQKGLERIYRLKDKLDNLSDDSSISNQDNLNTEEKEYLQLIEEFENSFTKAMDDDFNTPKAFAVIFEFVNHSNKFLEDNKDVNKSLINLSRNTLLRIGNVLTLFQEEKQTIDDSELLNKLKEIVKENNKEPNDNLEENIKILLNIRELARGNKDWKKADEIRTKLSEVGIEVQDTEKGPIWMKKIGL
jgi:cysteinyl-tRNA synthetase